MNARPDCHYASRLDVFKSGCKCQADFMFMARKEGENKPYSTGIMLACRAHTQELWQGWCRIIHELRKREPGLKAVAIDLVKYPQFVRWIETAEYAAQVDPVIKDAVYKLLGGK